MGLEREPEKLEIMSTEESSEAELLSSDMSESVSEFESVYPNDGEVLLSLFISISMPGSVRIELPAEFDWVLV